MATTSKTLGIVDPTVEDLPTVNWFFQYRSETWSLPRSFLDPYLKDWSVVCNSRDPSVSHGLCSSVTDTLDALWQPFRGEARGAHSTFHGLLGCYNLHRSDHEGQQYLFWSSSWGAPHKVFLYACQLVATYSEFADIQGTTNDLVIDECEGYPAFLSAVILGRAGTRSPRNRNREVPERCRVTLNYRNAQDYPRVHAARCPGADQFAPSFEHGVQEPCDAGMRPGEANLGLNWDQLLPIWNALGDCYSGSTLAVCQGPNAGSSYGGVWSVTMPPAGLFWRGYVCDALLFWARTLRDYALHRLSRGDTRAARQSFTTATHLARYALRYILQQSYTLVHEIGHTFRQDDWHCRDQSIEPTSNPDTPYCCFDFAAKAFQCRVRARLGLPNVQYNTAPSGDDFNNNNNPSLSQETCSKDGNVHQMAYVSCDTGVEGEPYHEARVLLSNITCRP